MRVILAILVFMYMLCVSARPVAQHSVLANVHQHRSGYALPRADIDSPSTNVAAGQYPPRGDNAMVEMIAVPATVAEAASASGTPISATPATTTAGHSGHDGGDGSLSITCLTSAATGASGAPSAPSSNKLTVASVVSSFLAPFFASILGPILVQLFNDRRAAAKSADSTGAGADTRPASHAASTAAPQQNAGAAPAATNVGAPSAGAAAGWSRLGDDAADEREAGRVEPRALSGPPAPIAPSSPATTRVLRPASPTPSVDASDSDADSLVDSAYSYSAFSDDATYYDTAPYMPRRSAFDNASATSVLRRRVSRDSDAWSAASPTTTVVSLGRSGRHRWRRLYSWAARRRISGTRAKS
ncbi:hypothetical protein PHLGIDRAFT_394982 [Phlebiopsis gigantea 11061_1 CR5-6]|uniref:Uncharacterized protein n=1 Tax=Phlebiopsis gigantea (strain 11061_1 CR5-6) TaxID=745531 RepID=A0A0C3RY96_PHLG1|nr:hypothetical protein PHLGIDRAFT_394982 [Phlebiopsis gigantea 11061_1 CR5-6]